MFGVVCGREIRAVLEGRQTREDALRRYAADSGATRHKYEALFRGQQSIRHLHGPLLDTAVWLHTFRRVAFRNFGRYLDAVHPDRALPAPPPAGARAASPAARAAA